MTNEEKYGNGTDAMHEAFQRECDCCISFCCDYKQLLKCQLEWMDKEVEENDNDERSADINE